MYISDLVTLDEVKSWKRGDNILIKSQTGTGKSFFITNILARYCEENNLRALIFSNRNLLKQQNEKLAMKNVECINYQFVEQMNKEKLEEKLATFDIINLDECHYFFKDASFNRNTQRVLEYALQPTNQIKIFLSATPEPLYYTDVKFAKQYDIPKNYSFIKKIVFYDDIADVLDEILESDYKSICFFSNATKACRFALSHPAYVKFFCSSGNSLWRLADKKLAKEIVMDSKFSSHVLATTTVLENGVNIVDSQLRNVVIDFYDPVTIIQTLGRKRLAKNDSVVLYLRVPTRYDVQRKNYLKSKDDSFVSSCYVDFLRDHFKTIRDVRLRFLLVQLFWFLGSKSALR